MKPRFTGVYKIENLINNKCYIGSSINSVNRIRVHKNDLRANRHNNDHLQKSWNKYSEENFKFEVLLLCSKNQLLYFEQMLIDSYQTTNPNFGYNKSPIAGNTLGYQFTEKQIENLKKGHKGQQAWNKGKIGIYSKESLKLISDSMMGRTPWNKGITRTEKEKEKMANNRKGIPAWNKGIKGSTKKKVII